jgi:hypothetical protein
LRDTTDGFVPGKGFYASLQLLLRQPFCFLVRQAGDVSRKASADPSVPLL